MMMMLAGLLVDVMMSAQMLLAGLLVGGWFARLIAGWMAGRAALLIWKSAQAFVTVFAS